MNHPLIIGYDAKRIVRNGTGLGNYGRTLVNDIARCSETGNHGDCPRNHGDCPRDSSEAKIMGTVPVILRLYAPDKGRDDLRRQIITRDNLSFCYPQRTHLPFGKSLWRSHGIVSDLKRDGVQLYHGLSGELPIGIRKSGIKSIVTIHDLIFLRHPEFYNWIDTKIYAWKFHQTLREADHIIAVSECTKRDIIAYGDFDESRISVIYQSYAPRFSVPNHGDCPRDSSAAKIMGTVPVIPSRYILSVGSIEARKNILLAVKALPYLPDDISLVIVGRHTKYTDEVSAYAKANRLEHRIRILHGVSDEELPALYAGAEVFVYPSRYEGFGIPIIEAIGSGLPVVACTGSCLEEAGGPDSLYVDPDDAEGMAQAIRQSLKGSEGREQRILRSREYIRRFEGLDVASQVIDLYRQLL
ncbi:MAG: glycosyltransferase family 4 protein [Prevotella sp.]|nr:glycosyltransferase family 4 protein [Prevotella sp.]